MKVNPLLVMNPGHRFSISALALCLALASLAVLPSSASPQTEAQRLLQERTGLNLSQEQILQRLQASGIPREEARRRLQQAGYDPSLVDPYYNRLESGEGGLPDPDQSFLAALSQAGILDPGIQGPPQPAVQEGGPPAGVSAPPSAAEAAEGPSVFGLELFRRATDQFQPVTTGPVDPDYRLGPGDEIILILTGDVELAYTLEVTREGFIVIPDVGQVSVNGLTLEALRERLYDRLGSVYSGVTRGPEATTRFDVSLGRLRTNQVFVIGDVARPGAYQVSSVGTVMTALYAAGGPTSIGSFRDVRVNRAGEVRARVDLYDYLLRGATDRDIRLDQGDVVFVPPAGFQVTVRGRVRRPAIYELRDGETLRDLIRFAGGFEPDAHIQRVQVDRILPPEQRRPGRDRVLLDADVLALETSTGQAFPLEPGDRITVQGILDRQEGRVDLSGDVWRPGTYEYRPGMTVWDLVREADGLQPTAYRPVAHVRRLILETGARRLLRISLATDPDGEPREDLPLVDLDQVRVFSVQTLRTADSVQVFGEVKNGGTYPLDEGTTVRDAILAAGGFTAGALAGEAEVMRLKEGLTRMDTVAVRYRVAVEEGIPHPLGERAFQRQEELEAFHGWASDFPLQDGDQVFVRRMPGYVGPTSARVRGEVAFPGDYAFRFRQERLTSFVERAGGLTGEAYVEGARLIRDSVPVGIELDRALEEPGGPQDVILEPGDELRVPAYDPTVLVQGAVAFPTRVVYREGWDLPDYLAEAGGSVREADMDRVSVQYMNGNRSTTRDWFLFRNYPDVRPGAAIFVPRKPEEGGTNWDQLLTRTLSITSTLLTILVAADRL